MVVEFYEAATEVGDTDNISAESNEGVTEHAPGDASVSVSSFVTGVAILPCLLIFQTSEMYAGMLAFISVLAEIRGGGGLVGMWCMGGAWVVDRKCMCHAPRSLPHS